MLVHDEDAPMHCMTYSEREKLKQFARRGEELTDMLIAIAHWMRSEQDVSFSAYVANWAAAQAKLEDSVIRMEWPLVDSRMIADELSEWGSYLRNT